MFVLVSYTTVAHLTCYRRKFIYGYSFSLCFLFLTILICVVYFFVNGFWWQNENNNFTAILKKVYILYINRTYVCPSSRIATHPVWWWPGGQIGFLDHNVYYARCSLDLSTLCLSWTTFSQYIFCIYIFKCMAIV